MFWKQSLQELWLLRADPHVSVCVVSIGGPAGHRWPVWLSPFATAPPLGF